MSASRLSHRTAGAGLALLLALAAAPVGAAAREPVRIGLVLDGPEIDGLGMVASFQEEILALTEGEFDVRFPAALTRSAGWTVDGAHRALESLLADPDVRIVLALGPISSHAAVHLEAPPKPVVAPSIFLPRMQGAPMAELPEDAGTAFEGPVSGVANLSYLTVPADFERDLRVFRDIVRFDRITVLASRRLLEALPDVAMRFREAAAAAGIELRMVLVSTSAAEALDQLAASDEAVYFTPPLEMPNAETDRLIAGINERRLPSFSLLGRRDVERGVLASAAPPTNRQLLARRTALNVQRILLGADAGSLPVQVARGERITINMATAEAIGTWPSYAILTEADLVAEGKTEGGRRLELGQVVREALAANLDLAAAERSVLAGAEDVAAARASLRPRLDLSGRLLQVDSDRAEASLGSQRGRTATGSLAFSQPIYTERGRASVDVQRHLDEARRSGRDQVRLDVALAAALSYLDVLRAETLVRVRRNDLGLTRSNLDRARVRERIGQSGRSDVYRWESRIATSRQQVLDAQAALRLAKIELNRVLNRPLEEPFQTAETGLSDPELRVSGDRLDPYIENPWAFALFRDFEVAEGLALAPELTALDAAIAAQERAVLSARRAFRSPTVSFGATVDHVIAEGGAGGDGPPLPGFDGPDDTDWSVAVQVGLPLYAGGARAAEHVKAREELERLRVERSAARERVEQRIRSALHLASASFAGLRLSEDAARASRANLDLVADAYARGVVEVVTLLDAQNAALAAEEASANAVHDFLTDVMSVQRAVGRFDYVESAADREAWFQRLKAWFAAQEPRKQQ